MARSPETSRSPLLKSLRDIARADLRRRARLRGRRARSANGRTPYTTPLCVRSTTAQEPDAPCNTPRSRSIPAGGPITWYNKPILFAPHFWGGPSRQGRGRQRHGSPGWQGSVAAALANQCSAKAAWAKQGSAAETRDGQGSSRQARLDRATSGQAWPDRADLPTSSGIAKLIALIVEFKSQRHLLGGGLGSLGSNQFCFSAVFPQWRPSIKCISRESNPGHIDGNDVFCH
jgi:hypothetical protein